MQALIFAVKILLNWIITALVRKVVRKYLNGNISDSDIASFTAYIVAFIMALIGQKYGFTTDMSPEAEGVVVGGLSNSAHSVQKSGRKIFKAILGFFSRKK